MIAQKYTPEQQVEAAKELEVREMGEAHKKQRYELYLALAKEFGEQP